jgi:hypothetical protein
MKFITIPATRPQYLEQVLDSLKANKNLDQYTLLIVLEPCYKKELPDLSWIKNIVIRNEQTRGVDNNQFFILDYAFGHDAEYVIRLEDDLCVSPDVTELAEWYVKQELTKDQMCMVLWSASEDYNNPTKIGIRESFCPWGNVLTKHQWKKRWKDEIQNKDNCSIFDCQHNFGWDWILNGYVLKNHFNCYTPILSRIKNVGVDGVYSNSDVWKSTFSGKVNNMQPYSKYDYSL